MSPERKRPGFWETVRLLLSVARKRAVGRRKRQNQLLSNRGARGSAGWGVLGFAAFVVFGAVINLFAGILVIEAVRSGDRLELERNGKIVISNRFLREATQAETEVQASPEILDREHVALNYAAEAKRIADEYGGDKAAIELKLRISFEDHGTEDFVPTPDSSAFAALATSGRLPQMLGSLVLLWWFVMLVCQGEGLELDLQ
jgi:hypothetical protein